MTAAYIAFLTLSANSRRPLAAARDRAGILILPDSASRLHCCSCMHAKSSRSQHRRGRLLGGECQAAATVSTDHFAALLPECHVRWCRPLLFGGARRDRTADLLHAMQVLSQLSYGPTLCITSIADYPDLATETYCVGLGCCKSLVLARAAPRCDAICIVVVGKAISAPRRSIISAMLRSTCCFIS